MDVALSRNGSYHSGSAAAIDQRLTLRAKTHLFRRCADKSPHLLHKLIANIQIQYPQNDKERCRDRRANNAPNPAEGVESIADSRGRAGDYD